MYLLDTNVISLVAPARRRTAGDAQIAAWIVDQSAELFLSVVTAAEIEDGIAKAERTGAARKAADLRAWWGMILLHWSDRILPIDLGIAQATGRLMDRARAAGADPGFEDLAIAATAEIHGLTVLTLNERHFQPLGVRYLNPAISLPA